ncbi:hypothetical protein [Geminicoccus roseus]|uniref:hypothetical protein n=1 Tax=Geminicoccus roseus TaxID=404900 RepID=UPI0004816B14|nr:hypothetical protein [Geminicoccus roseus]
MLVNLLGAALVLAGLLYMAVQALWRGRLSGRSPARRALSDSLEPPGRTGAFGLSQNWLGILMVVAGAVLLLIGAGADQPG